jgi:hypothetical protein
MEVAIEIEMPSRLLYGEVDLASIDFSAEGTVAFPNCGGRHLCGLVVSLRAYYGVHMKYCDRLNCGIITIPFDRVEAKVVLKAALLNH